MLHNKQMPLASSPTQAVTAHDLSGMSAAKAHNFFCESLCFLKVATLDGSLYNAEFICSQQRPDRPGIFSTTLAHKFCCLRLNTMSCRCRSARPWGHISRSDDPRNMIAGSNNARRVTAGVAYHYFHCRPAGPVTLYVWVLWPHRI